ncbi:hypothetical protein RHSIM_Rhsim12G0198900 [Rhododendron simsii]|uniref:peroxidase n=1 Tax=Rhododendron simsii TaxID=118357 RepID=A0A834L9M5_RHOSS|nr:hypothetical protein RHSIM_Rhsim12G0198900 [Rhododendron simsii]
MEAPPSSTLHYNGVEANENVLVDYGSVGGPFYPLETGKRDITFALRGFNGREVSLLGAHSIGTVHCSSFLNLLRSRCYNNHKSPSPSSSSPGDLVSPPSPQVPGVEMDYVGKGLCFSTLYYRSLLQGRGILCVDQQLTVGEEIEAWVRAYGSDASLFRQDFAKAKMKPSNRGVLIALVGQIPVYENVDALQCGFLKLFHGDDMSILKKHMAIGKEIAMNSWSHRVELLVGPSLRDEFVMLVEGCGRKNSEYMSMKNLLTMSRNKSCLVGFPVRTERVTIRTVELVAARSGCVVRNIRVYGCNVKGIRRNVQGHGRNV